MALCCSLVARQAASLSPELQPCMPLCFSVTSAPRMHRHSSAQVGKGCTQIPLNVSCCSSDLYTNITSLVVHHGNSKLIHIDTITAKFLCSLSLQPFSVLFTPCPCCWFHEGHPCAAQSIPPKSINGIIKHTIGCSHVACCSSQGMHTLYLCPAQLTERPVCTLFSHSRLLTYSFSQNRIVSLPTSQIAHTPRQGIRLLSQTYSFACRWASWQQ